MLGSLALIGPSGQLAGVAAGIASSLPDSQTSPDTAALLAQAAVVAAAKGAVVRLSVAPDKIAPALSSWEMGSGDVEGTADSVCTRSLGSCAEGEHPEGTAKRGSQDSARSRSSNASFTTGTVALASLIAGAGPLGASFVPAEYDTTLVPSTSCLPPDMQAPTHFAAPAAGIAGTGQI
ncbi:unnamed protein product [Protopolystoma xenopodis]|uniref:Uncharacterized protein n=1 Tax=Protopolystoma xenopodis TaxID=117903 RepID=A0A3S5BWI9_9PLAT|nr:unnamed protein product [Protopolystoma xenopodis]